MRKTSRPRRKVERTDASPSLGGQLHVLYCQEDRLREQWPQVTDARAKADDLYTSYCQEDAGKSPFTS